MSEAIANAPQTFTIIGEFNGAHFNGTYTAQEVVDRINSDSAEFTAELVDDATIKPIPRLHRVESTISIGDDNAHALDNPYDYVGTASNYSSYYDDVDEW